MTSLQMRRLLECIDAYAKARVDTLKVSHVHRQRRVLDEAENARVMLCLAFDVEPRDIPNFEPES